MIITKETREALKEYEIKTHELHVNMLGFGYTREELVTPPHLRIINKLKVNGLYNSNL